MEHGGSEESRSPQHDDGPEVHTAEETDPSGRYTRYNIVLGRGAFKCVYKAFDEVEGLEVAWNQVKVTDLVSSPAERERLFAEIRVLKQLKHRNIMSFMDSWLDQRNLTVNFITELFTSGTLRQYRKRHKNIDEQVLKRWAWQILQGLVYLHGHNPPIIHRDLKCDNIFVNGASGVIKIGDLGLATLWRGLTTPQSVLGTPEFMAPELYEEKYNEKVDVYSFGMCLLELATMEYPYSECKNAAQIYKKVSMSVPPGGLAKVSSPELRDFIQLCIQHDADKRPEARQLLKSHFFDSIRASKLGCLGLVESLARSSMYMGVAGAGPGGSQPGVASSFSSSDGEPPDEAPELAQEEEQQEEAAGPQPCAQAGANSAAAPPSPSLPPPDAPRTLQEGGGRDGDAQGLPPPLTLTHSVSMRALTDWAGAGANVGMTSSASHDSALNRAFSTRLSSTMGHAGPSLSAAVAAAVAERDAGIGGRAGAGTGVGAGRSPSPLSPLASSALPVLPGHATPPTQEPPQPPLPSLPGGEAGALGPFEDPTAAAVALGPGSLRVSLGGTGASSIDDGTTSLSSPSRTFAVNCRPLGHSISKYSFQLKYSEPEGNAKTIEFMVDAVEDTAECIASEMMEDLSLSAREAQLIAAKIEGELCRARQVSALGADAVVSRQATTETGSVAGGLVQPGGPSLLSLATAPAPLDHLLPAQQLQGALAVLPRDQYNDDAMAQAAAGLLLVTPPAPSACLSHPAEAPTCAPNPNPAATAAAATASSGLSPPHLPALTRTSQGGMGMPPPALRLSSGGGAGSPHPACSTASSSLQAPASSQDAAVAVATAPPSGGLAQGAAQGPDLGSMTPPNDLGLLSSGKQPNIHALIAAMKEVYHEAAMQQQQQSTVAAPAGPVWPTPTGGASRPKLTRLASMQHMPIAVQLAQHAAQQLLPGQGGGALRTATDDMFAEALGSTGGDQSSHTHSSATVKPPTNGYHRP